MKWLKLVLQILGGLVFLILGGIIGLWLMGLILILAGENK